jgi:ankyrin repeat protein
MDDNIYNVICKQLSDKSYQEIISNCNDPTITFEKLIDIAKIKSYITIEHIYKFVWNCICSDTGHYINAFLYELKNTNKLINIGEFLATIFYMACQMNDKNELKSKDCLIVIIFYMDMVIDNAMMSTLEKIVESTKDDYLFDIYLHTIIINDYMIYFKKVIRKIDINYKLFNKIPIFQFVCMYTATNILNYIISTNNMKKLLMTDNNNIVGFSLICQIMFRNIRYFYSSILKKINLKNIFVINSEIELFFGTLLKIDHLNPTYVCHLDRYFNTNQSIAKKHVIEKVMIGKLKNNQKYFIKSIIYHDNFDINSVSDNMLLNFKKGTDKKINFEKHFYIFKLIINHPIFDTSNRKLERLSQRLLPTHNQFIIELMSVPSYDFLGDYSILYDFIDNHEIFRFILYDHKDHKLNIPVDTIINMIDNDGNNIFHHIFITNVILFDTLIKHPSIKKELLSIPNKDNLLPFTSSFDYDYNSTNIFMFDHTYNFIHLGQVDDQENTYLHYIIIGLLYDSSSTYTDQHHVSLMTKNMSNTLQVMTRKMNVNAQNIEGNTALHIVCDYNENVNDWPSYVIQYFCDIIDIILNAKNVDPRLLNNENMSPFNLAILNKNYKIAKYLISHPKYKESLFYTK